MEISGKVVRYSTFQFKMSLKTYINDIDDDDGSRTRSAWNWGEVTTVIPNSSILWEFRAKRVVHQIAQDSNRQDPTEQIPNEQDPTELDPARQVKVNTKVFIRISESNKYFHGFFKVFITNQEGDRIPEKLIFVDYGDRNAFIYYLVKFNEILSLQNSEKNCFICFELHIAVDETERASFSRPMNDLGLLLDESLLTDTVLRVHGREIPVHRAILAARWPRFYEKFLVGSIDSVVEVAEMEPEVFKKILKSVYLNKIATSLIKDPICKDMTQIFEPTWLLAENQSHEPQALTVLMVDLDILWESDPGHDHELTVSGRKTIPFRCFLLTFEIEVNSYMKPTFELKKTFDIEYQGEDGRKISATWEIHLASTDENQPKRYSYLTLKVLENASVPDC